MPPFEKDSKQEGSITLKPRRSEFGTVNGAWFEAKFYLD
jgi:hypothetical protein